MNYLRLDVDVEYFWQTCTCWWELRTTIILGLFKNTIRIIVNSVFSYIIKEEDIILRMSQYLVSNN